MDSCYGQRMIETLRVLLEPLQPGTPLALQVERRGELLYLGVELE